MRALWSALTCTLLLTGCSNIPRGSDDVTHIPSIAKLGLSGEPSLGQVSLAPIATISLGKEAKPFRLREVFNGSDLTKSLRRGIDASKVVTLRQGDGLGLEDAFGADDDFFVSIAIENVRIMGDTNGWWFLNAVNYLLWGPPALIVAKEDYTLSFEAKVRIQSAQSGRFLPEEAVKIESPPASLDEIDRGFRFFGCFTSVGGNDEDNWTKVALLLAPATRDRFVAEVVENLKRRIGLVKADPKQLEGVHKKTLVAAVGVSRYSDTTMAPAPHAGADAEHVVESFSRHGAVAEHTHIFLDGQATRQGVEREIEALFKHARDFDTLVFYFAGYGSRNSKGAPVLLFHDADVKGGAGQMALDELVRFLEPKAGKKIVLLDASFDGSGDRSLASPAPANQVDDLEPFKNSSVAVMTAASRGQPAHAPGYLSGGLFTYHLITALDQGDGSDRTQLDGAQILDLLKTNVQAESAFTGVPQLPQGAGGLSRVEFPVK